MATTREWLMQIAGALEGRPTLPREDAAREMITNTPLGTILYLASGIPLGERDKVYAALPQLATESFAEAARLIRQAAEPLP